MAALPSRASFQALPQASQHATSGVLPPLTQIGLASASSSFISPRPIAAPGQAQTALTGIFASHSSSVRIDQPQQNSVPDEARSGGLEGTGAMNGFASPLTQPTGNGHVRGFGFSRSEQQTGVIDWDAAYEEEDQRKRAAKIEEDLQGWRGGHGEPRSAFSCTALPSDSYFAQPVTGDMSRHLPKEMVRVERDWSDGEVCQFETAFPMELDGRISPAEFSTFVASLNTRMASAYSVRGAVIDNLLAVATWWTSLLWRTSHFEKELRNAESLIADANERLFSPKGLRVLSPRDVALQFLEIE